MADMLPKYGTNQLGAYLRQSTGAESDPLLKGAQAESLAISDAVPRLPEYAKPGEYNTDLGDPKSEIQFQQWVKQNSIPFDPAAPVSDYDMRGFYKALQEGDPKAKEALNSNDGKMHFPDYWKTPYHESFSAESQWADPKKAPKWNDRDQLIMPDGKIVYDERAKAAERVTTKNQKNKTFLMELKELIGKHRQLNQQKQGQQ